MFIFPLKNHPGSGVLEVSLAEKLFSLGARTPVVISLCHLGKKTAIRLYKAINEQSPKQGMLPYDPLWVIRTSGNNVHASIFLGIIYDLSGIKKNDNEYALMFITAYELYCNVVANNPRPSKLEANVDRQILLDINRAWQLTHLLRSNEIGLVLCDKCQSRFLRVNSHDNAFQQCPICEIWADRTGRRRWATPKSKQAV
jgi:hypothetical protein